MDINYWNKVGKEYKSEIFSVCANDKNKIIAQKIAALFNCRQNAADFGCGIGYFLPLLSEGFKNVHAIDFSSACLNQARANYGHLPNVSFQRGDLAAEDLHFARVHVAFCCNVMISPSISVRSQILTNIHRHLYKNGHLALIVPSLESALFSGFRLIDWNLKAGYSPAAAVRCGFETSRVSATQFYQGIIDIQQTATKHFLQEELQVLLQDGGFSVREICKIEYDWSSELADPPAWMKSPYPWDWLGDSTRRRHENSTMFSPRELSRIR